MNKLISNGNHFPPVILTGGSCVKTSQHPPVHLFFKVSLKELWAAILKTRSVFRLGYLLLVWMCVNTHSSWGGKASIALWLLMSRLPLQQTHRHFHPLSVSHTVSAAVQGPARSSAAITSVSVLLRRVRVSMPVRRSIVPSWHWGWLMFSYWGTTFQRCM